MDGLREVNGNISAACDVLVLCRGQQAETEKFSAGVPSTVRVLSDQDGRCSSSAGVASFPFVIVTTADGAVLRKGMPTTKQQLEALVLENKSPSAKRNTVARAGV
jgi:hypothetical protein